MRRWFRALGTVAAFAVFCVLAGSLSAGRAGAAGGNAVINDCQTNGRLTHAYTLTELNDALVVMPASVKEYSNCQDVIQSAVIKVKTGKPLVSGSTSESSFLPTPVIVILVLLILAAVTFGALAVRRRRGGPGGGPGDDGPPGATGPPPPAAE